jgi:DNA-binding transcriptional ArsR family regulator
LTNYFVGSILLVVTSAVQILRNPEEAAIALDPVRLMLLENLDQPQSAASLSRVLKIPRQKINYHLREMEKAGLVKETETRKRGNCLERLVVATAKYYLVSPEALGKLGAGTPDPNAPQDRTSAAYLLSTFSRGIRDLVELRQRADDAGMRLSTMTLETEVRFRSPSERGAFSQELAYLLAQLIAQYNDTSATDGRTFRFVLGSYPFIGPVTDEPAGTAARKPAVRMD